MKMVMVALLLAVPSAYAFDVDGFRSGMTKAEVMRLLEAGNYKKISTEGSLVMAMDIPLGETSRHNSFYFCQDKLFRYTKSLRPEFHYFVRLFSEKRKILGPPTDVIPIPFSGTTIESNAFTQGYITDDDSLSVLWNIGGDVAILSYKRFKQESYQPKYQMDITHHFSVLGKECWKGPLP